MRISLHQLTVFKQVVEQGSVTLAAQALHLSQPAVSNILKQLTEHTGHVLFETIDRKLYVTQAGQAVLQLAQQCESSMEDTTQQLQALAGGVIGTLSIGIVSTAQYFVPRLLGAFKQAHPQIHVALSVGNRHSILQRLEDNLDDFVVLSQPPKQSNMEVAPFFDDQLVIVAPPQHASQNHKMLKLRDLVKDTWLLRERGSGTRMMMERLFAEQGIAPHESMTIGNAESIKQMIMAGLGISMLSEQSVELEVANHLLTTLPVQHFPYRHPWYRVSHRNKHVSPLVEAFDHFVKSHPEVHHAFL